MVVHNLNIVGIAAAPPEAYPPLFVDADAPLPIPVTAKGFKAIAWRHSQGRDLRCGGDHVELPQCDSRNRIESAAGAALIQFSRVLVLERGNHGADYITRCEICQA